MRGWPTSTASAIRRGNDLTGQPIWTSIIPGHSAHLIAAGLSTDSLYVSDGWGVAYSAIRFRRFDFANGAEVASVRTGTAVRCFAYLDGPGEILAATDTKLLRLDAFSLVERQRWDSRIPRYADTMAVLDSHAVVANWLHPRVGIVDLETGRVRRRPAPAMTGVLDGPRVPLLVGGQDGGVVAIDPRTGRTDLILMTAPALSAALSGDGKRLWILEGVRAFVSEAKVTRGDPSRTLSGHDIDGAQKATFTLPFAASRVVAGKERLWIHDDHRLLAVRHPVGSTDAEVWTAPRGQRIAAVAPDLGRILTLNERHTSQTASAVTCHSVTA